MLRMVRISQVLAIGASSCVASRYGPFAFEPRLCLPGVRPSSRRTGKKRSSRSRNYRLSSTNSVRNWVATPPTPRHPPRPIRWGHPGLWSRRPADANRAGSLDIPDIIAIASRPSGSRRSSPMCPRSAPTAKLPCPPSRGPATLSRPGIRWPNSPNWRPRSPNIKDTRAPALAAATSIGVRSPRRFAPM